MRRRRKGHSTKNALVFGLMLVYLLGALLPGGISVVYADDGIPLPPGYLVEVVLTDGSGNPLPPSDPLDPSSPPEIGENQEFEIRYEFKVPTSEDTPSSDPETVGTISAGIPYRIPLPEEINVIVEPPGGYPYVENLIAEGVGNEEDEEADVKMATARIYANYAEITFEPEAIVGTYRFTGEDVYPYYNVGGRFSFKSKIDMEEIEGSNPVEIEFPLGGGSTTSIFINVLTEDGGDDDDDPEDPIEVTIEKSGEYASGKFTWTIEVEIPEGAITSTTGSSIVITDLIQDDQSYVTDSARIDPDEEDQGAFEWDDVSNTLRYIFNEGVTSGVFKITFETEPEEFELEDGRITFSNGASVGFGDPDDPEGIVELDSDNHDISFGNFISKTGSFVSGGTSREGDRINWKITVNNQGLTLPAGTQIADEIHPDLELIPETVNVTGTSVPAGSYTYVNNILTYTFTGLINHPVELTFSTRLKNPDGYYIKNQNGQFNNTAELHIPGWGEAPSNSIGPHIPSTVISKDGVGYVKNQLVGTTASAIEVQPPTVTWEIEINKNKISIDNAIVTDTLETDKLEYVPGTYTVKSSTGPAIFIDGSGGTGTFTVTTTTGSAITQELKYQFGGTITDTYTITFDTFVKDSRFYAVNTNQTIPNTAALTGIGKLVTTTGSGISFTESATGNQPIPSKVIEKTGITFDHINWEATWEIVVNQKEIVMQEAYVIDTIGDYQAFVAGSLVINDDPAETAEFTLITNNDYIPKSYYVGGVPGEDQLLRVNFPEFIEEEQKITFKTKIIDPTIFETNEDLTITNHSKLSGFNIPENDVEDSDEIRIGNTLIGKTGEYDGDVDSDGFGVISWSVEINQNGLVIAEGAVLEDKLPPSLLLDTASIELYRLTITADGSYEDITVTDKVSAEHYEISYDGETFIFKFLIPIESPYLLKFKTDIDFDELVPGNNPIQNKIEFAGTGIDYVSEDSSTTIPVEVGTAQGNAWASRLVAVTLTKKGENNEPLEGAKFEILDGLGYSMGRIVETGPSGTITFRLKPNVDYYLREITAPVGHVLDESVHPIPFTLGTTAKEIEVKNVIIRGNIEFTKVDSETNFPLENVTFELHRSGYTLGDAPVATATSSLDGKVTFSNIEYGNYVIVEVTEPAGYHQLTEPIPVSITTNRLTVDLGPITNQIIKADVKIIKVDATDGGPLEEAEFAIYDTTDDNVPVQTKKTDETGVVVFEDLPYGDYYFEEIAAPTDYQLVTDKTYFAIRTTDLLEFEVENHPLRILIIEKEDANDGTRLAGAKFEVKSADGTIERTVVTGADGSVKVEELPFGTYTITEIEPADGYQLPDNPVKMVEITSGDSLEITETFVNHPLRDLIIKKVDADDNTVTLQGAKFEVKDGATDAVIDTVETGPDGNVRVEDLPFGTYTITEIEPPDGYQLPDNPVETVEIAELDPVEILKTFENYQLRTLIIEKVASHNSSVKLQGAEFEITNVATSDVINTAPTGADGRVEVTGLPFGTYTVKETKAPAGYLLNTATQTIEIKVTDTDGDGNAVLVYGLEFTNVRRSSPGGPIIPTPPVTPPTTPEVPTGPVDPTNPVDPGEPTTPVDPTEPVGPTEPPVPTEPVEPVEPTPPVVEETTTEETPVEGEIDLPDEAIPQVGREPEHGTVEIDENGRWKYTPDPGFTGKDTFSIIIVHPDGTEEELFFEIDVEEIPLGVIDIPTLPKTGETGWLFQYLLGIGLVLFGALLGFKKKKAFNQK